MHHGVYRRYVHLPHVRGRRRLILPDLLEIGDRYIVASPATGAWAGREGHIAEWNGSSWDFTIPKKGYTIYIEDENLHYKFNGGSWETL